MVQQKARLDWGYYNLVLRPLPQLTRQDDLPNEDGVPLSFINRHFFYSPSSAPLSPPHPPSTTPIWNGRGGGVGGRSHTDNDGSGGGNICRSSGVLRVSACSVNGVVGWSAGVLEWVWGLVHSIPPPPHTHTPTHTHPPPHHTTPHPPHQIHVLAAAGR